MQTFAVLACPQPLALSDSRFDADERLHYPMRSRLQVAIVSIKVGRGLGFLSCVAVLSGSCPFRAHVRRPVRSSISAITIQPGHLQGSGEELLRLLSQGPNLIPSSWCSLPWFSYNTVNPHISLVRSRAHLRTSSAPCARVNTPCARVAHE